MKKFRLPLFLLLALVLLALVLYLTQQRGSSRWRRDEFAVKDTASITRFFLVSKQNTSVQLVRKDAGTWLVNDSFPASPAMIDIMLRTFYNLEIKAPVPKTARDNMIRMLAGGAIKTEIYQKVYRINLFDKLKLFPHEKRTLVYYVGEANMTNTGTFMLREGSNDPYVVYIPGFKGFVNSRYSTYMPDWISHSLFHTLLPQIRELTMDYPGEPEKSFQINFDQEHHLSLTSLNGNIAVHNFDTAALISYMSNFKNLNYEALIDNMAATKKDSLLKSVPYFRLSLKDASGQEFAIKAWKRKSDPGELDLEGNPSEWDRERFYALKEQTGEWVSAQYFVFSEIIVPMQSFVK